MEAALFSLTACNRVSEAITHDARKSRRALTSFHRKTADCLEILEALCIVQGISPEIFLRGPKPFLVRRACLRSLLKAVRNYRSGGSLKALVSCLENLDLLR